MRRSWRLVRELGGCLKGLLLFPSCHSGHRRARASLLFLKTGPAGRKFLWITASLSLTRRPSISLLPPFFLQCRKSLWTWSGIKCSSKGGSRTGISDAPGFHGRIFVILPLQAVAGIRQAEGIQCNTTGSVHVELGKTAALCTG
jgi:hypothetical protein